jgi:hypothetical protein
MLLESTDDHLDHALHHITTALSQLSEDDHEAFAQAAYELRITRYGSHCRRKALLQRIHADLHCLVNETAHA